MDGSIDSAERPWFGEGLRFTCTGCGKCCTGGGGHVYLSPADLQRLAGYLELPLGAVARRFTRMRNGRRALLNGDGTDACIFLKDNACSVYEGRPVQCRTYPWWLAVIQDKASWREAARHCEGIDHPSAPLVPASEILRQCDLDVENDAAL